MSFKLRLQLSFTCSSAADKLRFILSVFTSVQSKFSCFFFCCCFLLLLFFVVVVVFFCCFYFRKRKSAKISEKISISRLLWSDRWKFHGEIQHRDNVHVYDK